MGFELGLDLEAGAEFYIRLDLDNATFFTAQASIDVLLIDEAETFLLTGGVPGDTYVIWGRADWGGASASNLSSEDIVTVELSAINVIAFEPVILTYRLFSSAIAAVTGQDPLFEKDIVIAEPAIIDEDGDGVVDDDCPSTPEGAVVDTRGCSGSENISAECPSMPSSFVWKNHGHYISCVTRAAEDAVQTGLLTDSEAAEIVSAAAKSSIGKRPNGQ